MTTPNQMPDGWPPDAIRWLPGCTRGQPPAAAVCVPHAGGLAYSYLRFLADMPARFGVYPLQLPGHETRVSEDVVREMTGLLGLLQREVGPYLDAEPILVGFCSGGLVAFEWARRLEASGRTVRALIVVASSPPDCRLGLTHAQLADRRWLAGYLAGLGVVPERVLASDELMAILLPAVRADLQIVEQHSWSAVPPLNAPIHAVGLRGPQTVPEKELLRWAAWTRGELHAATIAASSLLAPAVAEGLRAVLERTTGSDHRGGSIN